MKNKAVLILSGGIDSTVLLYWLKSNNYHDITCVTFNYGQRQIQEIEYAKNIAKQLAQKHHIIDVQFMQQFLLGSSLTNHDITMPSGTYDANNMQTTVVPNRNTIFLSLAWTIACANNANILAYGAQNGDHFTYPDTRPDYLNAINLALRLGTDGARNEQLELIAPFIYKDKYEVIKLGYDLGVDFTNTWSCYDKFTHHCGVCGACNNRKAGFIKAKIKDPTIYIQSA